jgi:hypothetical protein
VVLETIRGFKKLMMHRIVAKKYALENLERILPFLVHPNTWIKEEVVDYIVHICNPDNKILSRAEAYTIVRPKLKQFIQPNFKISKITDGDLTLAKLKPSLSREMYWHILTGGPKPPYSQDSDKEAA